MTRLTSASQYLPEPIGSDLGGAVWPTGNTDSICRRLRGHVPNGSGGQGSAPADRVGDEPTRAKAASSEDAAGELEARQGPLHIPGMHDSEEAEHST